MEMVHVLEKMELLIVAFNVGFLGESFVGVNTANGSKIFIKIIILDQFNQPNY